MRLLVDTSVWSLALRRDNSPKSLEIIELNRALESGDEIFVTGLILQELLQGFAKPKSYELIVQHFKSLPFLIPQREDYMSAAQLRNRCRKKGIQVGTIDALLTQLCIRHELTMLSTDQDFLHISRIEPLSLWSG